MNDAKIKTIDQVRQFLAGTLDIEFSIDSKDERYKWAEQVLIRFAYRSRSKTDKGLLLDFIAKVSGYSRVQTKRLVKRYLETGRLVRHQCTAEGFARKYTKQDIRLLAHIDELHDGPSGPTAKKLCERAWKFFGEEEYERLSGISVAHLYNLRSTRTYRNVRAHFDKTRSKASSIGERRKPNPQGDLGQLRVDTVHQGDLNGTKGVYYTDLI